MEAQVGWDFLTALGSAHPSQQQEEHHLTCMRTGVLSPEAERRAEEELSSARPSSLCPVPCPASTVSASGRDVSHTTQLCYEPI